ncbi:hypothetical protein GCM10007301_38930 [Azorhizobium oxalatiphilum]|uniref:Uncharacterized protein n=1 Tax=Azorhizobium oxalatiphilum TaxID=980631 RepID=A0A917C855_9HYPH|nr:hypothetical protein [Azorhizobium oxalatiphilum]GGF75261.1 hypothetical protein GCM10007301_38930 [Azorhizobium oxalatiphilum]
MTSKPIAFSHPIDEILLPAKAIISRAGSSFVHIDARTGEVVPKRGLKDLLRTLKLYELKTDLTVEIYDQLNTMRIFSTTERVDVRYRLSVTARSAQADKIVRSLADPIDTPGQRLAHVVEQALVHEVRTLKTVSPQGLLAEISRRPDDWQRNIARSIFDQCGLDAAILFDLPDVPHDEPVIECTQVMCTPDAPHRRTSVTFQIQLEPSGAPSERRLPAEPRARRDKIATILGTQFPRGVTLYDLWFNKQKVEHVIAELLSTHLRSTGFATRHVVIAPVPPDTEKTEQINCDLKWTGRSGRDIDFRIEATLTLRPDGAGLFDSLKLGPRAQWLEREARLALNMAMQGRDFEDMNLSEQTVVAERVTNTLLGRAEDSGQSISPFVVRPVIPENVWLQGYRLEIPAADYLMKEGVHTGRVGMTLDIRFETLRHVIDLVRHADRRGQSPASYSDRIANLVTDVATDALKEAMTRIDPNDFFSRWDMESDLRGTAGRGASSAAFVQERCVLAIQRALTERLRPASHTVDVRRDQSVIRPLVDKALALGTLQVTFEVEPEGMRSSADNIPVKLEIQVDGIDPRYYTLAVLKGAANLDPELVKRTAINAARQRLDLRPAPTLRLLNHGRAGAEGELYVDLASFVEGEMATRHGLSVQLSAVHVLPSLTRRVTHDLRGQTALDAQNMVELMEVERHHRLTARTADLSSIEKQIAIVRERMNIALASPDYDRNAYDKDATLLADLERLRAGHITATHISIADLVHKVDMPDVDMPAGALPSQSGDAPVEDGN